MTARHPLLRLVAAIFVTSLAGVACDESASDGIDTNVALFVNGDYVDYEGDEEPPPLELARPTAEVAEAEHEGNNVEAALEAFGATVTTFDGTEASDVEAALAGNQVLALPEPENGAYNEAFDSDAADEIASFVWEGGRVVIFMGGDDRSLGFLNDTFGWSIEEGDSIVGEERDAPIVPLALSEYSHNEVDSMGTPFQTGAETLAPHSRTLSVSIATLPEGALSMYDDEDDASTVAAVPYGSGWVVIMGWDWFDAKPLGSRDGGWNPALQDAIRF